MNVPPRKLVAQFRYEGFTKVTDEEINSIFDTDITEQEQQILHLRNGEDTERTPEEIGTSLQITSEEVLKLENRALSIIRHWLSLLQLNSIAYDTSNLYD